VLALLRVGFCRDAQGIPPVHSADIVEKPFRRSQGRGGGVSADVQGQLAGPVEDRFSDDDFINEADVPGLFRVKHARIEQEVPERRGPDPAAEKGRDKGRNEADSDLSVTETGVVLGQDEITRRCQAAASRDRRSRDRGNGQFRVIEQDREETFEPMGILEIGRLVTAVGNLLQGNQVGAGRKMPSGSLDQDSPDLGLHGCPFKGDRELFDHVRRERVGAFRIVEGQDQQGGHAGLNHVFLHENIIRRPECEMIARSGGFLMRQDFLPFCRPFVSEDDIAAVADVLRSGWITTGPRTAEFEREFAEFVGAASAVAVTSGSAGMHILLDALDLKPGDEVITPAMTWVSTANLIVLSGGTPVFADVDRDTMMVTPETIAEKISPRTRALIPVHFAGAVCDMDPLRELAADRGISLIEDAAHAVGARYRHEPIGKRGTCVFSFQAIKNLTTAEGGMITSDDSELMEKIRRLKFHGLGRDAFDRETQGRAPQAEVLEPGWKYNFTDINAAIGLGQLSRLKDNNSKRAGLAARYTRAFEDIDQVLPLGLPSWDFDHAWHLYVIRVVAEDIDRDTFMAELKTRNIGTGLHFRAVHMQRYYRERFGFRPGALPETEWNSERICSLPLFPEMDGADVGDVVAAIREVLGA